MSFCCNITVGSLECHLERHEIGGAKQSITLWSGRNEFLKYGE